MTYAPVSYFWIKNKWRRVFKTGCLTTANGEDESRVPITTVGRIRRRKLRQLLRRMEVKKTYWLRWDKGYLSVWSKKDRSAGNMPILGELAELIYSLAPKSGVHCKRPEWTEVEVVVKIHL